MDWKNDSRRGISFAFEDALGSRHGGPIAGIDEAGRGPWAGPVVAAAVILDAGVAPAGLNDSKRLSPTQREYLYDEIEATSHIAVAIGDVARIDRDNILQATLWAMACALGRLSVLPAAALIDGNREPRLPCPAQTIVGGDYLSFSIAAASIVAKVTRDRLMADLARAHPGYGWERNKGYGTREHAGALRLLGITSHHRRSFKPVARALAHATQPQPDARH